MAAKLSARKAETAKPGTYPDGGGLYLCISPTLTRTWVYRFSWRNRRPEMGLGSLDQGVGLAEARDARDEARQVLRSGRNPIEVRRESRRRSIKASFGEIADDLLKAKAREWRNEKHQEQWRWSLTTGAALLRPRPVDEIDTEAILSVLRPVWTTTPETAQRLRARIEAVLDAAKAQGLRSGENPAAWRGHLSHLLPKRQKLTRGHHAALPYAEMPAFMAKLRKDESISARALEFCVLVAARTGEVLASRWDEIDLASKVWTLPATRMKAGREHRVPLSKRACEILEIIKQQRSGEFIFPSPRGSRPLSHIAMAKVLARLDVQGVTVHGFRSAFRDWAGNETSYPRELAEAALAHVIGDQAEQAYRRSDALEKRRLLMESWSSWCEPKDFESVDSVDSKV
jgi:integrase